MNTFLRRFACLSSMLLMLAPNSLAAEGDSPGWTPLFSKDGVPEGWAVRHWADVSRAPETPTQWLVKDGVLYGGQPRGTWLVSEKEYGDFTLEFDWKLGEQGNSGVGIRFPAAGDPAFDGMEIQMVDPRYYGNAAYEPGELTGAIYKAVLPKAYAYRPVEWNHYEITCHGSKLTVRLNDVLVQDVDLERETRAVERGVPPSQRPRRGRIGFQELSRGGGQVQIRNARLRES